MSARGVDRTPIAEITDAADVGFGTFYNYFESKDDLAAQVLDCVIDDLGRRNDAATAPLKGRNPAAVQAISIRLTLREMLTNPMWKWWCRRPDLLAARLRHGFRRFGIRDLKLAVAAKRYAISRRDVEAVWSLQMWMLAGGVREILEGEVAAMTEARLVAAIMRAMGLDPRRAKELSGIALPSMPPPEIDFEFVSRG